LNQVEAAADAKLTIDGLAVTRPTNQVADAVPGVTLALTKTTTAPSTVRVASDSSALKTKIGALVSAYNDVVNHGHSVAGYGTTKAQNAVLSADTGVRRSLDRIASLATGKVAGTSDAYGSLSTVGLTLSRDGLMSFDGAKLDAALEKDAAAVRRLFVNDTASGATGLMKTLSDAVNALITGDGAPVKSRIESFAAQSKRLTESRVRKEAHVAAYEQQLRRQFTSLDQAMSRYQSMSGAIAGLAR
jgi:flagellar hook-associated protein 2